MKADKSFSAESKDKTESGIFNVEYVGRYMEQIKNAVDRNADILYRADIWNKQQMQKSSL